MGFDRKYLIWALSYLAIGMILGIYMASSKNHAQHATHAHINLVGFLLSLSYGVMHKLWLGQVSKTVAQLQFIIHQVGSIIMFSGLFLLFGEFLTEPAVGPVLGIASMAVLVGALLMIFMVTKSNPAK